VTVNELRLVRVVSQLFEENCYIVHVASRDDALIIDPGFDSDRILSYLDQQRLTPAAILNTHGHADHICGNQAIKQRWPACPLLIGAQDAEKLASPVKNLSRGYGVDVVSPPADQLLRQGDKLELAGITLEVVEIPGHSRGHVVFLLKDHTPWLVFGGDVLFQGSVGRTDFPDGNTSELLEGIREKLYPLPDSTIVLSGHGPETTIGAERRTNPFVRD
jgi:glyoxylase-like metal-dependent hydrolase (beta-lactamase superfamily II)